MVTNLTARRLSTEGVVRSFLIVSADGTGTSVEVWGERRATNSELRGVRRGRRTVRQSPSTPITCCLPTAHDGSNSSDIWQVAAGGKDTWSVAGVFCLSKCGGQQLSRCGCGITKNHEIDANAHQTGPAVAWRVHFWCRSSGVATRPQRARRVATGCPKTWAPPITSSDETYRLWIGGTPRLLSMIRGREPRTTTIRPSPRSDSSAIATAE